MPIPYYEMNTETGDGSVLVDRQTQAHPTRLRVTMADGTDAEVHLDDAVRERVIETLIDAGT